MLDPRRPGLLSARETLDWITERILNEAARGAALTLDALMFLCRRSADADRDDIDTAIDAALAQLEPSTVPPLAAWTVVETAMTAIAATLRAAQLFGAPDAVPAAITRMEAIVGRAYEPGAGMRHLIDDPASTRDRLGDQVRTASALLAAYDATARLPYSMLAEELVQAARRCCWDEERGGFAAERSGADKPFVLNCEAARALVRLAALSGDEDYRKRALVAHGADYAGDAARTLASQQPALHLQGQDAAVFGLALLELR